VAPQNQFLIWFSQGLDSGINFLRFSLSTMFRAAMMLVVVVVPLR